MRRSRPAVLVVLLLAVAAVTTTGDRPSWAQDSVAQWTPTFTMTQVVDLTPPRPDGRMVISANGRLSLMAPGGRARPFARSKAGYKTKVGTEAYVALSPGQVVPHAGCRFERGAVAGIDPFGASVVMVSPNGHTRRLAQLPPHGLLDGIAFDEAGAFGHRLLVTRLDNGQTALFAIDCRGRAKKLTTSALAMEGGMVVAPRTFGQYAGQLIIADEYSGGIYAISPSGGNVLVVDPGLPTGRDTGVESLGFVPQGFGAGWSAHLADRAKQPQPHPGDDTILTLDGGALLAAGVAPGDLLVAGEGGAPTIAIRCDGTTCSVQHVADGPTTSHAEGHIVFARRR
jgi:hypothetical protein